MWGPSHKFQTSQSSVQSTQARECRDPPSELGGSRHKKAFAGQKMLLCCPTFFGLWGALFVGPCSAEHAERCLNSTLINAAPWS